MNVLRRLGILSVLLTTVFLFACSDSGGGSDSGGTGIYWLTNRVALHSAMRRYIVFSLQDFYTEVSFQAFLMKNSG